MRPVIAVVIDIEVTVTIFAAREIPFLLGPPLT